MTPQASPKRRVATSPRMSERQLLDAVVDRAHVHGWLVFHALPLRRADGSWRTGTQGDKGYPDITLVRRAAAWERGNSVNAITWPRILFVELKSDRGRVSPEQQAWLDSLYPYSCVWRPADWRSGLIERSLR